MDGIPVFPVAQRDRGRGEEVPCPVLQGLPPAQGIDARPAGHRPAVIHLPVNRAHAPAAVPPPVFHARAHRLRLQPLARVGQLLHGEGIAQRLAQVIQRRRVAAAALLVAFHHPGEGIHLPFLMHNGLQRIHAGERLEAELRAEPRIPLREIRERPPPVPHRPVVHVAPVQAVRVVKPAAGGRRGRPVEHVRRFLRAYVLQQVLKLFQVILLQVFRLVLHPAPAEPGGFHLVVAADEPQGRMVPEAADIVLRLPGNALPESVRQLVGVAGEHQVLPYHQAHLVAQVKERLIRIDAAAPYADGIEMAVPAVLQQLFRLLPRHPGKQVVLRDVVPAHGEEVHPVAAQGEALAPFVLLPGHGHRPQAEAQGLFVFRLSAGEGGCLQGIQRLAAQAVRPPQPRVLHGEADGFPRFSFRGSRRVPVRVQQLQG